MTLTFDEAVAMFVPRGSVVRYLPNKGNSGDALIAAATAQVFARQGVFEGPSSTVFVSGGGALTPRYRCLARSIAGLNRNHRIVIGPSTVTDHWELLRSFPNLILMAREEVTHHVAKMNGVQSVLVHDAAFSYDYSGFGEGNGCLHAARIDGESGGMERHPDNRDISAEKEGTWTLTAAMPAARKFVSKVASYAEGETDRCHLAIVLAMLGRKTRMHPNSYFKNRAIFEMSMSLMSNVTFI